MNTITRTTHACTMETMNGELKSAMQTHGAKYSLDDFEADILMCCETITVSEKSGLFGGRKTLLSTVYVTPKWLVWADAAQRDNAGTGSAKLKHIEVRDYGDTASFAVTPDQGLNITGRFTDKNKTGITFIALETNPDGQRFRQLLIEAIRNNGK